VRFATVPSQARCAAALAALLLVALAAPAASAARDAGAPAAACALHALHGTADARAGVDPSEAPERDAANFATRRAPAADLLHELRGDSRPPPPPSWRLPPAAREPEPASATPHRSAARPDDGVAVPACRGEARWCRARGSSTSPG